MKNIIFGIIVLGIIMISGCELAQEDPQLAMQMKMALPGGSGSGGGYVAPCLSEGEYWDPFYSDLECCAGLEVMGWSPSLPGCEDLHVEGGVCTSLCGDGVCGSAEHYCSCPEDCQNYVFNCTDYDGGMRPYERSYAEGYSLSGNWLVIHDGCIDSNSYNDGWLREAVCVDNIPTWQDVNCTSGCSQGVCRNETWGIYPVCGNGIVEAGEECESPLDCGQREICDDFCICSEYITT